MEIYSIINDFNNITPNITQLHLEISQNVNITTVLYGVSISEDNVIIEFVTMLSPSEKIELNNIISSYYVINTVITKSEQKIVFKSGAFITDNIYRRVVNPFTFPGISYGKATCITKMDPSVTSYNVKIYDKTNNVILSETTLNNTEESDQNLGVLSNFSSEPWIIEIHVKKNGGNDDAKIYLNSLNLKYNL